MTRFHDMLSPLLYRDGLRIGDNLNEGNYMVNSPTAKITIINKQPKIIDKGGIYPFSSGKLKRIDFGSLKEINS